MRLQVEQVEHGFVIREDVGERAIGRTWAYSTLSEMLVGMRKLYTPEKPLTKKQQAAKDRKDAFEKDRARRY